MWVAKISLIINPETIIVSFSHYTPRCTEGRRKLPSGLGNLRQSACLFPRSLSVPRVESIHHSTSISKLSNHWRKRKAATSSYDFPCLLDENTILKLTPWYSRLSLTLATRQHYWVSLFLNARRYLQCWSCFLFLDLKHHKCNRLGTGKSTCTYKLYNILVDN